MAAAAHSASARPSANEPPLEGEAALIPYDEKWAPQPFGLNNTGVICYFNSFLQCLAGCTSFTRVVLDNGPYMQRSATGAALHRFVTAYAEPGVAARGAPHADISLLSETVLRSLVADLAVRRPHVRFGGGQESASEALVHLLDMAEPLGAARGDSPLTRLFLHRFRCELHCRGCRRVVSETRDHAVNFNLFHLDRAPAPPTTAASFVAAVRLQVSLTEGYRCGTCAQTTSALRVYSLTMAPEIIFCAFNLYEGYGGARRARYFPQEFELPAAGGGRLAYRLAGQVEHAGSLSSGHYWARGLRAPRAGSPQVYLLNDTGVTPSTFAPTPSTYLIAYHYEGHRGCEQGGLRGCEQGGVAPATPDAKTL